MNIQATAPGTLFIAGEYAVVTPGQPALIAAVNRYLTVDLTPSLEEVGTIYSTQQPNLTLHWKREQGLLQIIEENHPFPLITTAIEVADTYAKQQNSWNEELYHLKVTSQLDDVHSNIKFGLGSSGAVVVATIDAILQWHHVPVKPLLVYKLAAITNTLLGSNGSLGDIASSAFGGIILYQRIDATWIQEQLQQNSISEIVDKEWTGLVIQPLSLPTSLKMLVGWTKEKADTSSFVSSVTHTRTQTEKDAYYQQFLKQNTTILKQIMTALENENTEAFLQGIRDNRTLLLDFAKEMNIILETPSLTKLCQIALQENASAKTSGAGGGDCGICFITKPQQEESITTQWEKVGILPLNLEISPTKGAIRKELS